MIDTNESPISKTESMKKMKAIIQSMNIENYNRLELTTRLSAIEACLKNMCDALYLQAVCLDHYKLTMRSERHRAEKLSLKLARQQKYYRRKLAIAAAGQRGKSSKPAIQNTGE